MSDDMPGTSGWVPPGRPKVAWVVTEPSIEDEANTSTFVPPSRPNVEEEAKNEVHDPLKIAWTDFTERISVAGWKEAFDEPIVWIRHQYKVALIVFSLFCCYYSGQVIVQFFNSRNSYVDEITDFAELSSMPVPNVTICAQVYFNQTFIRDSLIIPSDIKSKVAKFNKVARDDFYRQLTLYITPMMRAKELDAHLFPLFNKIIRVNPQTRDYVSFAKAAWPKCEQILHKCWFDGFEFDCCQVATISLNDDGVCYWLRLNMDSDNAYPSDSTRHQRSPGPGGGLTVEARLVVRDFPFISDDAQNGFLVLVGHTSNSAGESPICAPHGSETYIKVVGEKHALASNCAPHGNLRFPTSSDLHQYMYYDPEGESCALSKVVESVWKVIGCHDPIYSYYPNASIVCQPRVVNTASSVMTEANYAESFLKSAVELDGNTANKTFKRLQALMKETMNNKARCPYHCEYWTYRSTASFNYLENSNDSASVVDYMFSKIHVYYGSLDYRQHREVPESSVYLAFCDFGNVVGLYWGMSIVSFFHVFYYVPRYLYLKRKMKETQRIDDMVVHFVAA